MAFTLWVDTLLNPEAPEFEFGISGGSDPEDLHLFSVLPRFDSSTCSQKNVTFPSSVQILVASDDSSAEVERYRQR